MRLDTLQDLLVDQLHDLYSAEQQINDALPRLSQAASSSDLKKAFQQHHKMTEQQINRLEEVFQKLGISHDHHKCEGMDGLIREGQKVIEREGDPAVKDAALIAAAQRVEHYEMSGYGAVRTYARELGYSDIADLLQETLDEEGERDKQLTSLAKGGFFSTGINEEAPQ